MKRKKLLIGVGISLLSIVVLLGIYAALHQFLPFNPNHFSVRGYTTRNDSDIRLNIHTMIVRNDSIFFKRVDVRGEVGPASSNLGEIRLAYWRSWVVPPLSDFAIFTTSLSKDYSDILGNAYLIERNIFPIVGSSQKDKGTHDYNLTHFKEAYLGFIVP